MYILFMVDFLVLLLSFFLHASSFLFWLFPLSVIFLVILAIFVLAFWIHFAAVAFSISYYCLVAVVLCAANKCWTSKVACKHFNSKCSANSSAVAAQKFAGKYSTWVVHVWCLDPINKYPVAVHDLWFAVYIYSVFLLFFSYMRGWRVQNVDGECQ